MKTLYRLDTSILDIDGRYRTWITGTQYDTLENIRAQATAYTREDDQYKIVARTIDEETFTVTDTEVENWSWWHEVGRYKKAEKDIEYYTAEIEKLEVQKERSKSDRRKISLHGEIKYCKKRLEEAEELLKQKK